MLFRSSTISRSGVIVLWSQHTNSDRSGPVELLAQHVDSTGTLLWGAMGSLVRSRTTHTFLQAAAPDDEGGAFFFWLDERAPGLFMQHFSRSGLALWAADGVPVPRTAFVKLSRPVAVPDGTRGAIVAWVGATASDSGVFAARVAHDGKLPWKEPVQALASALDVDSLQVVASGRHGVILAWRVTRNSTEDLIFAQSLSRSGRLLWKRGGQPVSTSQGLKDCLALSSDERGGAYVAWSDSRPNGEVFATHLDNDGDPVQGWARDGSPVCPRVATVSQVQLVPDGRGEAIAIWTDDRTTFGEGFKLLTTQAMKLTRHGPASSGASRATPLIVAMADRIAASVSAPVFALRGMQPNPGSHGNFIHFALPDETPAALELFDLAGRRLWSRDVGSLGAGEHAVRLSDGAWLPPGVYLTRLVQGRQVATVRIAIIR